MAVGRALYNFTRAPDWTADIEDLCGLSVFFKDDDGAIYLTYASFARGGEEGLAAFAILGMMDAKGALGERPPGRRSDWQGELEQRPTLAVRRCRKLTVVALDNHAANGES